MAHKTSMAVRWCAAEARRRAWDCYPDAGLRTTVHVAVAYALASVAARAPTAAAGAVALAAGALAQAACWSWRGANGERMSGASVLPCVLLGAARDAPGALALLAALAWAVLRAGARPADVVRMAVFHGIAVRCAWLLFGITSGC